MYAYEFSPRPYTHYIDLNPYLQIGTTDETNIDVLVRKRNGTLLQDETISIPIPFPNQNQASRGQPYLSKDTFSVLSPSLHADSVASTCDQCGIDVPTNLDEV